MLDLLGLQAGERPNEVSNRLNLQESEGLPVMRDSRVDIKVERGCKKKSRK